MRTFIVGDIHNGFRALKQVMDRAPINHKIDKLIFLGDYIDGWPDAVDTVNYLINLKKVYKERMICIRGNHDIWLTDWLHTGEEQLNWLYNGGLTTLTDYKKHNLFKDKTHRDFFNNLVNWHIDDENRIFIHGGWDYRGPFGKGESFILGATKKVYDGLGSMSCHWDRSLFKGAKSGANSQETFKATREFKEVYIGHTAVSSCLPEQYGNLWNLDSGGGWSGKLTIMDINSKEYWQSDFVKNLYPEEKGR